MDSSLLRREEIKFVDRDDETEYSEHYALSDFKTPQRKRKHEDYLQGYFLHRYGAIRDIDFSPVLE
jgi:hypothetical protein